MTPPQPTAHPDPAHLAHAVAEQWGGRLRRYAASVLRNEARAADAVQDVLLRLCEPAPGGGFPTEEPAVRAWLFKAVRNRCIDLLRKEGRMSLIDDAPTLTLRLSTDEEPSRLAERRDEARSALAALDRLPPLQREALRLKFSGELSYREIADAMGKSVSHVGVLIHDGLKTLRQQLA